MPTKTKLGDKLLEWENQKRHGQDVSVAQLCHSDPDIREELQWRVEALEAMDRVLRNDHDAESSRSFRKTKAQTAYADLKAGSQPVLGYTLVRRIGKGGCGEVWQASAPGDVQVALKFVYLGKQIGAAERRALEIVKSIRHPNLLSISASWEIKGFLVIAMELADRTVFDRFQEAIEKGMTGIPRDELLEYMRQTAQGIDFLNQTQHTIEGRSVSIQHRDIKPQNLLLVGGGVKLGDFGLVRTLQSNLTAHTGTLTPAYAAPEFFEGRTSSASDQYSLAVTYCQMRSGQLPFNGNAGQIMRGHLEGSPDLNLLPESERSVVLRALAKEPNQRWPSCSDLIDALTASKTVDTTPAASATVVEARPLRAFPANRVNRPTTWNKRRVLALTGFACLLMPLVFFLFFYPSRQPISIDLLERVDLNPNWRSGEWVYDQREHALHNMTSKDFWLQIPFEPPSEYVLEVDFERKSGNGWIGFGVVTPSCRGILVLPVSGPASLDGVLKSQKETKLRLKSPNHLSCTVQKGHVTVELNGEKAIDWHDDSTMRVRKEWQEAARHGMTIIGNKGTFKITRMVITPLQESGNKDEYTPKYITNSIGMKFALIPAGKFMMGSPKSEVGHEGDESPQHEVQITKSFYMGIYEVTQEQYKRIMGENPSGFSAKGDKKSEVKGLDTRTFPVENMSWEYAVKFCNQMSGLPGERASSRVYRLPTEAEWEYACRGGTKNYQVFHFGNTLSAGKTNCNSSYPGDKQFSNYLGRTTRVGSYAPNSFGLYDMHGNLNEWCADWYDANYYSKSPLRDPLCNTPTGFSHVFRGGSWGRGKNCRSAKRFKFGRPLQEGRRGVGFRVVLDCD